MRIVENSAETVHFIMPPDPNALLADEDLATVAGGIPPGQDRVLHRQLPDVLQLTPTAV